MRRKKGVKIKSDERESYCSVKNCPKKKKTEKDLESAAKKNISFLSNYHPCHSIFDEFASFSPSNFIKFLKAEKL